MYQFIVALILFLVTGYLTVTEMAPFFLVHFIFASAALGVLLPLYACVTDFACRIVTLHDCYEHVNMDTPYLKAYSENYFQALLQISLQQFYGMLSKVVLGMWQSVHPTLFSVIKIAITYLRIPRSRHKNHRKPSPYSALRIAIVSILLVYLARWRFPAATSYAALRLAGLVLGLLFVVAPVLVLVYWFHKHPMIQQIGSDICTLLDKEPNVTDPTEFKKRPAHTKPVKAPTRVSSSKTDSQQIQREEEEAQKVHYADPGRIDPFRSARQFPLSGSTTRRGWNASRQNLASPGSAPANIGQSPEYALGYMMETSRQPVKTPGPAGSPYSSLSLPQPARSAPTSDGSTQANTSVDVLPATVSNLSVALPPSEGTLTTPERTNKLITEVRVESNNLPMRAPRVVEEAQVTRGENKWVALLHRSQWKQKHKCRALLKETKKVDAPAVVCPSSPMDTNDDWNAADMSEMDEDEVYMEMDSRRSSPIGSPMVCSPIGSPSPMQVSSPMELSSPMRAPSPMQISSPMRVSSPVQVSVPFQTSTPVSALAPVQVLAPVAPAVVAPTVMAEAAPGVRKIKELPRRKTGAARSSRIDAPSSSATSAFNSTATVAQPTLPSRSGHSGSGYSGSDSIPAKANGLKRTHAIYIPSAGQALPPRSCASVSGASAHHPTPSEPNKLAKTTTSYAPPAKPTLRSRSDTLVPGVSIDGPKLTKLSSAFRIPEPGRALPRPGHPSSGPFKSNGLAKSAAVCTPAVMTPRDLAAALDKKATGAAGTMGRPTPVYMLMDKERTVVKKGEMIPPNTPYLVKDKNGTKMTKTGPRGLRV
ncbi:hypothetical protein FRC07_014815 [Ceratobasidium sp. 392]|nr:hypothetical protein FRC07_014815 [Ceratobasidium sp. 392]